MSAWSCYSKPEQAFASGFAVNLGIPSYLEVGATFGTSSPWNGGSVLVIGELIARMTLFKTAKREKTAPLSRDRAILSLELLFGLAGHWEGVRRDWDPDEGTLRSADKLVTALFELNFDGTHLIVNMGMKSKEEMLKNFDVWGHDNGSRELVRTAFSDGLRLTDAFGVTSIDIGRDQRVWKLVLETISWDEGRPCEIRYQISRVNRNLDMRVDRRLISSGMKYEKISHLKLMRKR